MDKDTSKGLYRKYYVKRLKDKERKHQFCNYFVLDLKHDKFAKRALWAYAQACKTEYPELAKDLKDIALADV